LPPGTTTRKRLLPSAAQRAGKGLAAYWDPDEGGTVVTSSPSNDRVAYLGGTQVTVSEGHPISRLRKGGLEDIGGPFESTRQWCDVRGSRTHFTDKWKQPFGALTQVLSYDGVMIPRIALSAPDSEGRKFPSFPPSARSSNDALDEFGATAIARCKPTNPPVDAAQALGELWREGLPHLIGSASWKARSDIVRSASEDYLNVQFGWRPLISDISDFTNTVTQFDTVLAQYERDAGGVVRRRYEFPIERSSDTWEENLSPTLPALAWPANLFQPDTAGAGKVTVVEETTIRRWFSGAFTYYLPTGYDSRDKISRLRLMADRLGIQATPDTVWELTPWSWAVDWFSNAGDVISNISDFGTGGLVMRYGYMMEHSIKERTYTQPKSGYRVKGIPQVAGPLTLVTETKVRRPANPFGFGVTWEGLSTFQASILAALGITRRG